MKRYVLDANALLIYLGDRRAPGAFYAAELAMQRTAVLVTAHPEFQKLGKRLSVLPLPRHRP